MQKEISTRKQIEDCKEARGSQWYSKLKRMCRYNQHVSEQFEVEEISDKSHSEQANLILDSILKVNNSYEPLKNKNITKPEVPEGSIPNLTCTFVETYIKNIKTKPSTPPGDIPAHIVKRYSRYLSKPLTHILNTCLTRGE